MIENVKKLSSAVVATAFLALPSIAHAGTSTANGTASMSVVNQCSVTGANANLGTFTASQKWSDVASALGQFDGSNYTVGTMGQEYVNFGSVTCDANWSYTLIMAGTATGVNGAIKLTVNGKVMTLFPAIKKLGPWTRSDSSTTFAGAGTMMQGRSPFYGGGLGMATNLMGSAIVAPAASGSTATLTDGLGTAGTYSDTLSYTLWF